MQQADPGKAWFYERQFAFLSGTDLMELSEDTKELIASMGEAVTPNHLEYSYLCFTVGDALKFMEEHKHYRSDLVLKFFKRCSLFHL